MIREYMKKGLPAPRELLFMVENPQDVDSRHYHRMDKEEGRAWEVELERKKRRVLQERDQNQLPAKKSRPSHTATTPESMGSSPGVGLFEESEELVDDVDASKSPRTMAVQSIQPAAQEDRHAFSCLNEQLGMGKEDGVLRVDAVHAIPSLPLPTLPAQPITAEEVDEAVKHIPDRAPQLSPVCSLVGSLDAVENEESEKTSTTAPQLTDGTVHAMIMVPGLVEAINELTRVQQETLGEVRQANAQIKVLQTDIEYIKNDITIIKKDIGLCGEGVLSQHLSTIERKVRHIDNNLYKNCEALSAFKTDFKNSKNDGFILQRIQPVAPLPPQMSLCMDEPQTSPSATPTPSQWKSSYDDVGQVTTKTIEERKNDRA